MKLSTKFVSIIALSIVALGNAAYLTDRAYEMRSTKNLFASFCDINAQVSCTNVLASPYAEFFGIPFPAIALVVYPVILLIALYGLYARNKNAARAISLLAFGGMIFNSIVIYRETVYINAYCILCLICTGIIVSIFALTVPEWKKS